MPSSLLGRQPNAHIIVVYMIYKLDEWHCIISYILFCIISCIASPHIVGMHNLLMPLRSMVALKESKLNLMKCERETCMLNKMYDNHFCMRL